MKLKLGVLSLVLCMAAPAWGAETKAQTKPAKPASKAPAGKSSPGSSQFYRWVDSNGKVHYGDTMPAEYANQGSKEINKSGRVLKETAPALTPEQIKARSEAEARDKEAKASADEQKRRDKALLASFTTVGELDLAEKRNLEAIDVQIKSRELRIKSVQGRLDSLKKQEERMTSRNKPIPDDLTESIQQTEKEIASMRGYIGDLEDDKREMRSRYAADRKRFMELKGMQEAPAKP